MEQLLWQGGWVLAAIGGLSVAAWGLAAWTWLELRRAEGEGIGWAAEALERLRAGDREGAADVCGAQPAPAGRAVLAAIRGRSGAGGPVHGAAAASGRGARLAASLEREVAGPARHLPLLGVLATVAPLLGLLGTVMGMAATFAAIQLHGTGEVEPLAVGIRQALLTTQAGLVVALPVLLLHGWLAARARVCAERAALLGRALERALQPASG